MPEAWLHRLSAAATALICLACSCDDGRERVEAELVSLTIDGVERDDLADLHAWRLIVTGNASTVVAEAWAPTLLAEALAGWQAGSQAVEPWRRFGPFAEHFERTGPNQQFGEPKGVQECPPSRISPQIHVRGTAPTHGDALGKSADPSVGHVIPFRREGNATLLVDGKFVTLQHGQNGQLIRSRWRIVGRCGGLGGDCDRANPCKSECLASGLCVFDFPDHCGAISDADCKPSLGCIRDGRCIAEGGLCVAQ